MEDYSLAETGHETVRIFETVCSAGEERRGFALAFESVDGISAEVFEALQYYTTTREPSHSLVRESLVKKYGNC